MKLSQDMGSTPITSTYKYNMITKTTIKCDTCGKKVEKLASEIKRQKKKGKNKFYCNKKCVANSIRNKDHIKKYSSKNSFKVNNKYGLTKIDQFTPFRYHIRNAKRRKDLNKEESTVDVQFLKCLWDSQNGCCAITGIKLEHRYLSWMKNQQKSPYQASLDRIDNSKGYIKGNVRFVCLMYNYARNTFSDQQVLDFFRKVANK